MIKVLFVCLGNICRSPAAHAVFEYEIVKRKLAYKFIVDSAGTSDHHEGDLPDSRMITHGKKRGYDLCSLSRPFEVKDFTDFDVIIAMDNSNRSNILKLDVENKFSDKVLMFCDFCKSDKYEEVPDPYWSGADGFEEVLDIVEDGVAGIIAKYD